MHTPFHRALGFVPGAELGRGRVAVVHRAHDPVSGRAVALKVARDPAAEAALVAEYRTAGDFEHEHLVTPEALVRLADGRVALVLPLIEGERLADVALDPERALVVALGLCRAVAVLHGRGRLHGDLSPDNVLVDAGGARVIDVAGGEAGRIGTPGFIAPEVLAGGAVDARAELYSLGCLLFGVLVGRPVFAVPGARQVHHHLHVAASVPESLPPRVREVLGALLAKAPEERGSADAVLESIAAAAGGDPAVERRAAARAMVGGRGLVGRGSVRARLEGALDALERGWGGTFVVAGPAGSGRRSLGRWLVAAASRRGWVPVVLPVDGAADAAVDDEADDDADAAGERVADRDADRVVAWVAAAETAPRCVLVDGTDADPVALRRALAPVQAAARLAPVLLVALASDGAGAAGLTADAAPAEAEVEAIALGPLEAAERRLLVFDRLGVPPDRPGHRDAPTAAAVADLLGWLDRPGALVAALGGLVDAGLLVRGDGGWTFDRTRPDAATAVVDAASALDALPDDGGDRRRLAALAAWGRPCPPEVLAAIEGAPADLSPPAELTLQSAAGLAPRRPDLARRALAALSTDDRAALYRRAAAIPAPPGDPAAIAWRVHHRVLGGLDAPIADRVAAAEALVRHGRSAAALAVLGDESDRRLAAARAEVLLAQGRVDAARAALGPIDDVETAQAVARLWTRVGRYRALVDEIDPAEIDPTGAAPALRLALASARLWLGELDAAAALATPLADDADAHTATGARHTLATVAWQQGRLAEAEAMVVHALAEAPDDARALRSDLLRTLGGVRIYRGELADAEAPLLEAMQIARDLGRLPELAKSLNNLGILRYQRGDWNGARAAFEQYQLLCGRVGAPVERANVANNLGQLALCLGEPERALLLFDRALALCEAAGYPRLVPVARSNRGAALTRLERFDEAAADFAAAAAGLDAVGGTHDRVELDRRRVELCIAQGDWAHARALAEALYADPVTDEIPVEAAQVRRLLAECAVASGEVEAASAHIDAAIDRFEALDCNHELATARETRARVMVATGKYESAILECRRALLVHRALGARGDAVRTTGLLSEAEEHYRHSTQSVRHAEILLELSMTLGTTRDPEALLRRALEAVCELVDAERGLVALDDGEIVTHGLDWAGPGHALPVSESIVAETRRTGRPVVVQDAIDDGAAWTRTSIALLGLRSILCVPVRRGEAVMGVLYLDSSRLVATDLAAEVELMSSVARLVGVAVENARLFAAEAARAERATVIADAVQRALADLDAAARTLDDPGHDDGQETARTVAHELRALATSLRRTLDAG